MMLRFLSAVLLLLTAVQLTAANEDNERPTTAVINLLKDMLKQLKKDAEDDEAIFDKLACWCETNDKEKTQAIKDAEATIADLTVKIEGYSATSARLDQEIKQLDKEVVELQESLDAATALREKQLAEYNEENKETLEEIQALKSAISVLSKHHGGAFLQVVGTRTHLQQVAATLDHTLKAHAPLLRGVLTPSQRKTVLAFVQEPTSDFFDAAPTFKQSYAPQSGQIFGILRQMKETFDKDMAEANKEEARNLKEYEELKAAKEKEISASQEQIEKKTQELADTNQNHAQAKTTVENTKAQLSADEQFLMDLKEKCQMNDQEWDERQKTRALEVQAVSEALKVLSGDDAHESFGKTFNFMQVEQSDKRQRVSKLLSGVARKVQSPRLSALAVSARLDSFTKVKKAIDDMIKQLSKQKDDEIKKRDYCINAEQENELNEAATADEKAKLENQQETLEGKIGELERNIETAKSEIDEMNKQLEAAGKNRDAENQKFQEEVANQRETLRLLNKALEHLQKFYGAAFLQHKQPAPAGFDEYKHNAASGSVMDLIGNIIADTKQLEAESTRAEEEAQEAYEGFHQKTSDSIAGRETAIGEMTEEKAGAEQDLVATHQDLDHATATLAALDDERKELKAECNFLKDNFDLRQKALADEIESLRTANAILSGKDLQSSMHSDSLDADSSEARAERLDAAVSGLE